MQTYNFKKSIIIYIVGSKSFQSQCQKAIHTVTSRARVWIEAKYSTTQIDHSSRPLN